MFLKPGAKNANHFELVAPTGRDRTCRIQVRDFIARASGPGHERAVDVEALAYAALGTGTLGYERAAATSATL